MQKAYIIALSILCRIASAETASPSPVSAPPAPIYDRWYSVSSAGKVSSAYNERLEDRGGKLFFQVRTWRRDDQGQIIEESVGGLSSGDASLTPQFFSFHTAKSGIETNIDGSFSGRVLTAKVRHGDKNLAPIKKTVPSGTILSNFFPVLLKSVLTVEPGQKPRLKPGVPVRFTALLEDSYEQVFPTPSGTLQLDRPDAFATQNKAAKLTVKFAGMVNTWWVDELGSAFRIEIPAARTRVERVTAEQAEKFLKAIGTSGDAP